MVMKARHLNPLSVSMWTTTFFQNARSFLVGPWYRVSQYSNYSRRVRQFTGSSSAITPSMKGTPCCSSKGRSCDLATGHLEALL
ncbi:UNVERIFIED_CONTAM: hypothetical protein Sangu_2732300 [Sesamum angustifolium]|uniref:Secreted protein n=1 Tax=Sesamum angustifolium TaxID=2727405 RepID=A0AAW2IXC0_9LAMI